MEWLVFMWPANIIALTALVIVSGLFYALRSKVYLFRFMTQVEAAVPALATASVLTVIMGLSRQVADGHPAMDPVGLSRMLSFWPFVLIYLWNVVIVAEVGIHQLMHFRKRFIPSLVSHIGLFIFITCGTLGSADMQRLKMYCEEGKPEWRGIDNFQQVHELPIAIELQKFSIDEYPPKLAIFDTKSGKSLPAMLKMIKGMPAQMMKMMRMDDLGMRINAGGFVEYKDKGAATAILVRAQKGNVVKEGWVSSGSYMFPMSTLKLDKRTEIAMSAREPLRYASDVNIYTKDGQTFKARIEVNKPVTVGTWKIYQLDFNKEQGKWSTLSVYELVSDPWLPATYVGIYLLIIGAVLMFVTAGRNKYKKEEGKK